MASVAFLLEKPRKALQHFGGVAYCNAIVNPRLLWLSLPLYAEGGAKSKMAHGNRQCEISVEFVFDVNFAITVVKLAPSRWGEPRPKKSHGNVGNCRLWCSCDFGATAVELSPFLLKARLLSLSLPFSLEVSACHGGPARAGFVGHGKSNQRPLIQAFWGERKIPVSRHLAAMPNRVTSSRICCIA